MLKTSSTHVYIPSSTLPSTQPSTQALTPPFTSSHFHFTPGFFFIHKSSATGATTKRGKERLAMLQMQWSSTTGENYQQNTVSAVWLELSQSGKKCVFFFIHRYVTGTTIKRGRERPAMQQMLWSSITEESMRTTEQQSLHLGLPKKGEKGGRGLPGRRLTHSSITPEETAS